MKSGTHGNGLRGFRRRLCGRTYAEDHMRPFGNMIEEKALLTIDVLLKARERQAQRGSALRHGASVLPMLRAHRTALSHSLRRRCNAAPSETASPSFLVAPTVPTESWFQDFVPVLTVRALQIENPLPAIWIGSSSGLGTSCPPK
jgi:hypothetical protein